MIMYTNARKEVYKENVRNRVRFGFPSFSSTQEVRGLETGNRFVDTEQMDTLAKVKQVAH